MSVQVILNLLKVNGRPYCPLNEIVVLLENAVDCDVRLYSLRPIIDQLKELQEPTDD